MFGVKKFGIQMFGVITFGTGLQSESELARTMLTQATLERVWEPGFCATPNI